MPNELSDIFCDYLDIYCSRTVWNETQKEYRHNIKLSLQETRPQVNVWARNVETVALPDSSQYFVYMVPLRHFAGLDVRSSDWATVTTLLSSNRRVQLRFHDFTGKLLTGNLIYYRSSSVDDHQILIAINAQMLRKIVGSSNVDLFIGVYFDSDIENDVTEENYIVNSLTRNTILTRAPLATHRLKNGYAVKALTSADLVAGDYVTLIFDENVTGTFSIDLSNDDATRVYISADGQSKYIIHIPKELNPTNKLISHDTCDFYIYPRNLSNASSLGRYLHRAQGYEVNSFIQLTHNDFGVPTSLIDQFKSYLGSDEVTIQCFIRNHSRSKSLIRDRNYIDFLYQLNDTTILDFLEGNQSSDLSFWSARNLESSNFIRLMKDVYPQTLNKSLDFFTEALGYINTASLLSGRIYRYTGITASGTITKTIVLPLAYQWQKCPVCGAYVGILETVCSECNALLSAPAITAIVSVNGKKLPFQQVSTAVVGSIGGIPLSSPHLSAEISLGSMTLSSTDELILELNETNDFLSYVFSPTEASSEFWFKADDYDLFTEVTLASPVEVVNGSYNKKYQKTELALFNIQKIGELSKITFNNTQFGYTYLIQTKKGSYGKYLSLDDLVSENQNLVYTPNDEGVTWLPIVAEVSANSTVFETISCSGADVYKYTESGYVYVSATAGDYVVTDIGISKKRFTFSESTYGNSYLILQYQSVSVPVMSDQQLLIYMNGKMLVENVDFWRVKAALGIPYQYIIQNISYLLETGNFLEFYGTDAEAVVSSNGFVSSPFINAKKKPTIFYPSFTSVFTDGFQIGSISYSNGRVNNIGTAVTTRNGALYQIKTDIPPVIRESMNESLLEEDISRFDKIATYFSKQLSDDPAVYTIPYSHHLYSVYLNTIIDDVLDGRLSIPDETDFNRLVTYLTDYDYLKRFDLTLQFTDTPELDINDNPTGRTISTSLIDRRFIDVFPSYTQRLVEGSTLYATLLTLIDNVVPEDTIVDKNAVDTTVNTN